MVKIGKAPLIICICVAFLKRNGLCKILYRRDEIPGHFKCESPVVIRVRKIWVYLQCLVIKASGAFKIIFLQFCVAFKKKTSLFILWAITSKNEPTGQYYYQIPVQRSLYLFYTLCYRSNKILFIKV